MNLDGLIKYIVWIALFILASVGIYNLMGRLGAI
jgi:hypothetical protein